MRLLRRATCLLLFGNPVQRVERHHDIEMPARKAAAGVSHHEHGPDSVGAVAAGAVAIIRGEASTLTAYPSGSMRAAARVSTPSPQPTSSTRSSSENSSCEMASCTIGRCRLLTSA
jgi:hypothetical protein